MTASQLKTNILAVAGTVISAALFAFSCCCATAAAADLPVSVARAGLSVGEPAGFANLLAPQQTLVDVYFGGTRMGDALVAYGGGTLTFIEPEKLIALLPDLADPAAVKVALGAADLPAHSELDCTAGANPTTCGRLDPPVAGIIFNPDKFRVDVFVNSRLLLVRPGQQQDYLPVPERGLSLVDSLGGVLSGSSRGSQAYNFQNRTLVGDANKRLEANLAYASGYGIQTDRLLVAADTKRWRYSAGTMWAPGTDLIGRRQILGVGAETQIDTRLDKDQMRGSPIVVFLSGRARVDVLRDGRMLSSRVYNAGNQSIDTAELPEGSYEIVLNIEEAGGIKHEERRFFSKTPQIAAIGQKILFAYAGVLTDTTKQAFLPVTGIPFFQAGTARRLSSHFAFDTTALLTNRVGVVEAGAYYISPVAMLRIAAVGSTQGAYGGLLQMSSQTGSRFNFTFDLRHMHRSGPLQTSEQEELGLPVQPAALRLSDLPLSTSSYSQISGAVSYSLPGAQLGLSASWRREANQRLTYSIAPSVRWEFLRRGQLRFAVEGDVALTDRGHSDFAGLSLQLLGKHAALTSNAGVRSASLRGEPSGTALVGALGGSWQTDNVAGGELNMGAVYERDLGREAVTANANFRGETASVDADVIQGLGQESGDTQYSLGFRTMLAARHGTVAMEGRSQTDGMILVKLEDTQSSNSFEVLVNDAPVGTVRESKPLAAALSPYKQYQVRIHAIGSDLLSYDASVRNVTLYPGNVALLTWTAKHVVAMFGRLVFEDGRPMAGAWLTTPGSISQTNDNGYFQIETAAGSVLEAKSLDGKFCSVKLPPILGTDAFAQLGTLTCGSPLAASTASNSKDASL